MSAMLKDVLRPELVRFRLESDTKEAIIHELIELMDHAGVLPNRDEAEQAVLRREAKLSTGLHMGIAIPHGKSSTVKRLTVAMGLKPDGIDFQSLDGEPTRIVVLTVSPESETGPHIQFMAEISRLLIDGEMRRRILAAKTPEALVEVMVGADACSTSKP